MSAGPIDVHVTVESADQDPYRRPGNIARALQAAGYPVRSVVVVDRATGLTSSYRDEGDDSGAWPR